MKIIQVIDYQTFGDRYLEIAKQASEYADIIWFRIKDEQKVYTEAKRLREALPEAFLSLSLNADIASELGYQAVQLGADSDIEAVRARYSDLMIGYSAHSIQEISDKQADYYTLSPIFMTKKDYKVKPLGLIDVSVLDKEIYALGGVSYENLHSLRGLGFAGVAGISFYSDLNRIRSFSIT